MVVDGGFSTGCMRNIEGGGGFYHQEKSKNKYTKVFSITVYIFQSIHSAKWYLKCTKVHKTSFSKHTKYGQDCTNYRNLIYQEVQLLHDNNSNYSEDWRVQYWCHLEVIGSSTRS